MIAGLTRERTPTLAEYLRILSVGDACPWCGTRLEPASSRHATGSLRCVACGLEMECEEWPFRIGGPRGEFLAA
jgi:hypothetical protein